MEWISSIVQRWSRPAVGLEAAPGRLLNAAPAGTELWREPLTDRLSRRLVSIPGLVAVTAIYTALLPLLLIYALAADLIRRRRLLLVRFHALMAAVLWWHIIGLASLTLWWVIGLPWKRRRPETWVAFNRALEGWWGSAAIGIAELFYGARMTIRGAERALAGGPVVVFSRHASIIDTMLPLRILEHHHGMNARIVKKRELLWDPCVDLISYRLPRTFVRRGSNNPRAEVEMVRRLTANLGDRDGVWIFPEGTRWDFKKREHIIERLGQKGDVATGEIARSLQYTLPPKPGGALALLEACRGIDVVFCAHVGMEGANKLDDLVSGSLLGRTIEVELWRVPAAEIPDDPQEQIAWLNRWWKRIDDWVAVRQPN